MPWRYVIFSVLVLTTACGVSKLIAKNLRTPEMAQPRVSPAHSAPAQLVVEDESAARNLSGSSIAPGGAGGRQSQFSAVLTNTRS